MLVSTHVETVCLLSNRKPDSYVHLNLKMEDYYRIKDAQKEQDCPERAGQEITIIISYGTNSKSY